MAQLPRKRKCLHCKTFYYPDHRNVTRQRFCSKPECRQASKVDAQQRWRQKPDNLDYFKGQTHVERVRQWRLAHPGYWRHSTKKASSPLQDDCPAQPSGTQPVEVGSMQDLCAHALQDLCQAQLPLLVGLMHQLLDSPLQEDILPFARRLIAKGQDLLDRPSQRRASASTKTVHAPQACSAPGSTAPGPTPVQLGRSPIGPTTTAP